MFVFMPLFFGHQLLNIPLLLNAMVMCVSFSFIASAVYCLNDIIDVEADRRHPVKCKRPIASGDVSVPTAYLMMLILIAMSISVLFLSSVGVVSGICVIVAYLLMEIAYCLKLKRYAIIDVCMLSLGFVLRIIAGGVVTDIVISHWLVMMTFLLTLFLGIAKRRDDVLKMMRRKVSPHAATTSCVKRSCSSILVGSPVFSSTTASCIYRSSPMSTKILVRYRYRVWKFSVTSGDTVYIM